MKVEFGVLFDGKKGNGWRDINFELWIDGVKTEFYRMKIYYDRWDKEREYEVSYVDDIKGEVTVYRDLKKYKKNIDDWWIGEERGIDVFNKIEEVVKEESRFSFVSDGFWEEIFKDYRLKGKVIEI